MDNPNPQNDSEVMAKINQLRADLDALNDEYYKNNFSANQDFTKNSNFTSGLKVPHYASLPSTCQVGQVGETSGKLYICSAANTWSVVGTQS